jgi:hypothetical protein
MLVTLTCKGASVKSGKRISPKSLEPGDLRRYVLAHCLRNAENGCLEWQRARTSAGYGHFYAQGQHFYAHTVMLKAPLEPGEETCHTCDNPPCCDPKHVFAGTRKVNVRDAVAKGRLNTSGLSKNGPYIRGKGTLTPEQISEIRTTVGSTAELARRFGVSASAITKARKGVTWRA